MRCSRVPDTLFCVLVIAQSTSIFGWNLNRFKQLPRVSVKTCMSTSDNNVLVLDHLNINHERGRHDLLRAFYFDVLGCAIDPRKQENLEKGRKTLWANCGIHQFHFSEGSEAQVFDGLVTLAYDSLEAVRKRLADRSLTSVLQGSAFAYTTEHEEAGGGEALRVTDPWGTQFRLVVRPSARDGRGSQPGPTSEPIAVPDLTVHVPPGASLAGIERFYTR